MTEYSKHMYNPRRLAYPGDGDDDDDDGEWQFRDYSQLLAKEEAFAVIL